MINKISLILQPTPLYRMKRLSDEFGCNVYVKRDDLTGIGFGGNKVRKLEYLLAEALEKKAKLVVSGGSLQTNCGMLSAIGASIVGLPCVLFLYLEDDNSCNLSGNLVLDDYIGCSVEVIDVRDIMKDASLSPMQKDELCGLRKDQRVAERLPYYLEKYGVSKDEVYTISSAGSTPRGVLGYVDCVREMAEQPVKFDYIFCGNGSGGTYAGLLLGSRKYFPNAKVLGVNIEDMSEKKPDFILELLKGANALLGWNFGFAREDLTFLTDAVMAGYDIPDDITMRVIENVVRKEGFFLDPVYTGKIFNGAFQYMKREKCRPESNILILHSGGGPGLFNENMIAYRNENSQLLQRWKDDSN